MKPCWKDAGLTEEGAKLADAALDGMIDLVQRVGNTHIARAVLREATFRLFTLPGRAPVFQEKYLRGNGAWKSDKRKVT